MKQKIHFTEPDEPLMIGKRVYDLNLPTPAELAAYLKPKGQKITITLDPKSIHFFKEQARLHGAKYQSLIRELVTQYAQRNSVVS